MKSSKGYAALLLAGVLIMGACYVVQYNWYSPRNAFRGEQPNENYGQQYEPGMMGVYQNYYESQSPDEGSANSI